jgi:hypothetical protein
MVLGFSVTDHRQRMLDQLQRRNDSQSTLVTITTGRIPGSDLLDRDYLLFVIAARDMLRIRFRKVKRGSKERSMRTRQRTILRLGVACGLSVAILVFVVMFTRILLEWTT